MKVDNRGGVRKDQRTGEGKAYQGRIMCCILKYLQRLSQQFGSGEGLAQESPCSPPLEEKKKNMCNEPIT